MLDTNAIDLDKMDIKELKDLNRRITKAIDQFDSRKKNEAMKALEALAQEHGFSLSELIGVSAGKTRKPADAKYVNPDNPGDTWSGRGRKPRWAINALMNGKTLEDLLIDR